MSPSIDGRVTRLLLHPVKSMHGIDVRAARVLRWGYEGDRRWMVVDRRGVFVSARTVPGLAAIHATADAAGRIVMTRAGHPPAPPLEPRGPRVTVRVWGDDVEALSAPPGADRWLAGVVGRDVRLVHLDAPDTARPIDPTYAGPDEPVAFADGFPLLLANDRSLDALNTWQEASGDRPLDMARFRPSLAVAAERAWVEDTWTRIAVGEVELRLVKPCARCVVTTVDPDTGERQRGGPLRNLARHRPGVTFAVNVIPATTGWIRLGDPVRVLERAVSSGASGADRAPDLRDDVADGPLQAHR